MNIAGQNPGVTCAPSPVSGLIPTLGPRLVFFTGGTALRDLSRQLTRYTHNSVHLITPFDSGGSSAALRRAFAMPAVGDIRNRLLALADRALVPQSVLKFCARRLPAQGDADDLRAELQALGAQDHPLWAGMPEIFGGALRLHLRFFLERMPQDFDPHLASLGNLVLAGGYLHHKRNFGPVLAFFSRLLQVRGVVLPIVGESLHLAAELDDGSRLVGQHRFKELTRPVHRLFLTVHEPECPGQAGGAERAVNPQTPCRPPLAPAAADYLRSAGAWAGLWPPRPAPRFSFPIRAATRSCTVFPWPGKWTCCYAICVRTRPRRAPANSCTGCWWTVGTAAMRAAWGLRSALLWRIWVWPWWSGTW